MATLTETYLPRGRWADFFTHQIHQGGKTVEQKIALGGVFRLPAFVREGAIIPMMVVDEKTKNAFGDRISGARIDVLQLRLFPAARETSFTYWEDDGKTVERYDDQGRPSYKTRSTQIILSSGAGAARVRIMPAEGAFRGVQSRNHLLELILEKSAQRVSLNGKVLPKLEKQAFASGAVGWELDPISGLVRIQTGVVAVSEAKEVEVIF